MPDPTHASQYAERLMTAGQAVALVPSGARVVMGLGVSQPPALLKALADRAEAGEVEDLKTLHLILCLRLRRPDLFG